MQEATTTLSSRIGVFAASAESKVKEAYSQLQTMLQRLKELIDRYHALLSSLNDSVENIQKEELEPTVISLDLNATRVFVENPFWLLESLPQMGKFSPTELLHSFR